MLTGAGISTPSGIPDYRSPDGSYSRGHKPITHAEFVRKAENRQRYWARSFIGFEVFSRSRPNAAHLALDKRERVVADPADGRLAEAGERRVPTRARHRRLGAVEVGDRRAARRARERRAAGVREQVEHTLALRPFTHRQTSGTMIEKETHIQIVRQIDLEVGTMLGDELGA